MSIKENKIHVDLQFKGWGTSLAWWANIDYPEDIREYICDLIFCDLKLNIVRYNLGGGTNPDDPQTNMRPGALVPCLKDNYNSTIKLESDKYQIKILDDSIKRGVDYVELFCNSPPWWMTLSGKTSGHFKKAHNNIDIDFLDDFVNYINECSSILNEKYKDKIKSISPFNEPSSPFWTANNSQEGCFWSYDIRKKCIEKLYHSIKNTPNLTSINITAADSFCSGQELLWHIFAPKDKIDKVNIHGYNLSNFSKYKIMIDDLDIWRYILRYLNYNKPIWMSEYGIAGGDNISSELDSAISLSKTILRDLRTLKPQAWIYWQVVEDFKPGSWGLIDIPFDKKYCSKENIKIKKVFYALKHFTNTLRPGDTYKIISNNILKVTNESGNKISCVILNDNHNTKNIYDILTNLINKDIYDYNIKMYTTDICLNYEEINIPEDKIHKEHLLPNSITSIILNKKLHKFEKYKEKQESFNIIASSECDTLF